MKRTCAVNSCPNRKYARGFCSKHYERLRRHGGVTAIGLHGPGRPKTCEQCGSFFSLHPRAVYDSTFCSDACRGKFHGADSKDKSCTAEGCVRPLRAKGLCNMHYKRLLRSEGRLKNDNEWNERKRAAWKERQALKRGADSERIVYSKVFERDSWICGICGGSVDESLEYPDPFSVSLDHIVPLSLGGTHTYGNVQCSHLQCNVSKGDRLPVAG